MYAMSTPGGPPIHGGGVYDTSPPSLYAMSTPGGPPMPGLGLESQVGLDTSLTDFGCYLTGFEPMSIQGGPPIHGEVVYDT